MKAVWLREFKKNELNVSRIERKRTTWTYVAYTRGAREKP